MAIQKYPTLRETKFVDLMQRRIFNVLIIANPYDAFMLEDDGRVDEKIFDEYAKLGLRFPPRFFKAGSREEAEKLIEKTKFDLVICMPGTGDNNVFDIARGFKNEFPDVPIVVLTPFIAIVLRFRPGGSGTACIRPSPQIPQEPCFYKYILHVCYRFLPRCPPFCRRRGQIALFPFVRRGRVW